MLALISRKFLEAELHKATQNLSCEPLASFVVPTHLSYLGKISTNPYLEGKGAGPEGVDWGRGGASSLQNLLFCSGPNRPSRFAHCFSIGTPHFFFFSWLRHLNA